MSMKGVVVVFAVVIIFIALTLESRSGCCCCWIFISHVVVILLPHLDGTCRWSGNETGLSGHSRQRPTTTTKAVVEESNNTNFNHCIKRIFNTYDDNNRKRIELPNCNSSPRIQWNDYFDLMGFFPCPVVVSYYCMFVLLMKMYFVMESYCTENRNAVSLANIASHWWWIL